MANRWKKVKSGSVWHLLIDGKLRGSVHHCFDTWDAYVETGRKWPESRRRIRFHLQPLENPFYAARRAVELALSDRLTPGPSPAKESV